MTDREQRLRERIDWLADQRDAALADLHRERDLRMAASARSAGWARRFHAERRRIAKASNAALIGSLRKRIEQLECEVAGERFRRRQLELDGSTTAATGTPLDGTHTGGRKEANDAS